MSTENTPKTLRELTVDEHTRAENTPIMRYIFGKIITPAEYQAYAVNTCLIYAALEPIAKKAGVFNDLPGIERLPGIRKDIAALDEIVGKPARITWSAHRYYNYILRLTDLKKIQAHIYVRYAGDLYGGQMLKTLVPGPGNWYDFGDSLPTLRNNMRMKFTPETVDVDEAKKAFKVTTEYVYEITESPLRYMDDSTLYDL